MEQIHDNWTESFKGGKSHKKEKYIPKFSFIIHGYIIMQKLVYLLHLTSPFTFKHIKMHVPSLDPKRREMATTRKKTIDLLISYLIMKTHCNKKTLSRHCCINKKEK